MHKCKLICSSPRYDVKVMWHSERREKWKRMMQIKVCVLSGRQSVSGRMC